MFIFIISFIFKLVTWDGIELLFFVYIVYFIVSFLLEVVSIIFFFINNWGLERGSGRFLDVWGFFFLGKIEGIFLRSFLRVVLGFFDVSFNILV